MDDSGYLAPVADQRTTETHLSADELAQRARRADLERREAALTLSAQDSRCPLCRGPVVIGATVRTVHATSCPRRIALVKARKEAARRVAAPAPAALAELAPVPRQRGPETAQQLPELTRPVISQHPKQAAQPAVRESRPHRRSLRPEVMQAWRVDGCRVTVDGWPATVRGQVRMAGERPEVRLDFDDYDTWTREDQAEIPDWWDLEDLDLATAR